MQHMQEAQILRTLWSLKKMENRILKMGLTMEKGQELVPEKLQRITKEL